MKRTRPCEVIGHAGADGFFPANTMESFRKAVELGVDRVECDLTGDAKKTLFLTHDQTISVSGRQQNVQKLRFDDIRNLDPHVVPLDDFISIVHGKTAILLDLKARGLEKETIEAIERIRHGGDDVSVSSTHGRTLRIIAKNLPDLRVGLSRGHWVTRIPTRRLQIFGGWIEGFLQIIPLLVLGRWCHATEVMVNFHLCTPPVISAMHAARLRVYAWTPERVDDFEKLLKRGVDGIITHRPDRLIEILTQHDIPRL